MKKILALAVLSLALVGCGPTYQEAAVANNANFNTPMKVGTLPDGRVVQRIAIAIPNNPYPHYVYFVEGGGQTTNQTVPQGKTQRIQTNSLLD